MFSYLWIALCFLRVEIFTLKKILFFNFEKYAQEWICKDL